MASRTRHSQDRRVRPLPVARNASLHGSDVSMTDTHLDSQTRSGGSSVDSENQSKSVASPSSPSGKDDADLGYGDEDNLPQHDENPGTLEPSNSTANAPRPSAARRRRHTKEEDFRSLPIQLKHAKALLKKKDAQIRAVEEQQGENEQLLEDAYRQLHDQAGRLDEKESQIEAAKQQLVNIDEQFQEAYGQLYEKNVLLEDELASLRDTFNDKLDETTEELETARKKWKKTAAELNKVRTMNQPCYQVDDRYLTDLTERLQLNIRDFAIQYFQQCATKESSMVRKSFFFKCLEKAAGEPGAYSKYMGDGEMRPHLVQAFIWRVLVRYVFNHFRWIGNRKRVSAVQRLWKLLKPDWRSGAMSDDKAAADAQRKFRTWSSHTVSLLLDVPESPYADDDVEDFVSDMVKDICDTIGTYPEGDLTGFEDQIRGIIEDAMNLDKEISKQVCGIEWVIDPQRVFGTSEFSPLEMEAPQELQPWEMGEALRMVVSPSMIKRGRSTGDDFVSESRLVKMVVVC